MRIVGHSPRVTVARRRSPGRHGSSEAACAATAQTEAFPVSAVAQGDASGRGRTESTDSFLTKPDPFGRKAAGRSVTCCRGADTRTTQWDTLAECDAIGKAIGAVTIEA